MSVEKFRPGTLKHQSKPYSVILNFPLQNIKNIDALAIWVFLQTKPENWSVNRQNIQNHFDIGKDRVYKAFVYLIQSKLLVKEVIRTENGTHSATNYIVCNGEQYLNIDVHESVQMHTCTKKNTIIINDVPPLPDLPLPAEPLPVNPPLTNKRIHTKKRTKQNNICASDDARDSGFDEFWKSYPLKKNKARATSAWKRNKCFKMLKTLLQDIDKRKQTEWLGLDPKFIPHASSYLNGKRWEDEIDEKTVKNQKNVKNMVNEPRSTIKFWEPGNPDYNRANGIID